MDVPVRQELNETAPKPSRGTGANALAWIPSDGGHRSEMSFGLVMGVNVFVFYQTSTTRCGLWSSLNFT